MIVSVGEASNLIGVSISTLRRWEKENNFLPISRTCGWHRRYSLSEINERFLKEKKSDEDTRINICYSRVSSHDQKLDLKRQTKKLEEYCKKNKIKSLFIEDLGSGINFKKRGLKQLIDKICTGSVNKLIVTHRDRLLRFGTPLLFQICKMFKTEIIILNEKEKKTFEENVVQDVLEIMTVYSLVGRISGYRHQDLFVP